MIAATAFLALAALLQGSSASPAPRADVVVRADGPMITPPPSLEDRAPTRTWRNRRNPNILSDLESEVASDVGDILTELGSAIPSYVASGVSTLSLFSLPSINCLSRYPTSSKASQLAVLFCPQRVYLNQTSMPNPPKYSTSLVTPTGPHLAGIFGSTETSSSSQTSPIPRSTISLISSLLARPYNHFQLRNLRKRVT